MRYFSRCFLALSPVSGFALIVLLDFKLNDTRATAISECLDYFATTLSVGSINKAQRIYYQFNNPESQRKKGLRTD